MSSSGRNADGGENGTDSLVLGTGDCWYLFDFDQTHILSAQAGYDLPRDFGVSAQIQYVTGNPTDLFDAGIYDADGDFYNGKRFRIEPELSWRPNEHLTFEFRYDYNKYEFPGAQEATQ